MHVLPARIRSALAALAMTAGIAGTAEPARASSAFVPVRGAPTAAGVDGLARTPQLTYHGGPIVKAVHVYLTLWHYDYGDPLGVGPALQAFVGAVGGSAWLDTVTQYYGKTQGHITNPAQVLAGVWNDNTDGIPFNPQEYQIAAEADKAAAHFGADPNGVYLVALARHHDPLGFGSGGGYCGYNSFTGTVPYIAFPYLPDAPNNGYACGAGAVNKPGLLDGVSIVAGAEIATAMTNPDPPSESGWFGIDGIDIGALCQWNGLQNTRFGSLTFPTQPLYSDAAARCVQHGSNPRRFM